LLFIFPKSTHQELSNASGIVRFGEGSGIPVTLLACGKKLSCVGPDATGPNSTGPDAIGPDAIGAAPFCSGTLSTTKNTECSHMATEGLPTCRTLLMAALLPLTEQTDCLPELVSERFCRFTWQSARQCSRSLRKQQLFRCALPQETTLPWCPPSRDHTSVVLPLCASTSAALCLCLCCLRSPLPSSLALAFAAPILERKWPHRPSKCGFPVRTH